MLVVLVLHIQHCFIFSTALDKTSRSLYIYLPFLIRSVAPTQLSGKCLKKNNRGRIYLINTDSFGGPVRGERLKYVDRCISPLSADVVAWDETTKILG